MQHIWGIPIAAACIRGETDIRGEVRFYEKCGGVFVAAEIRGLPEDGFHGFHIHVGKSCGGAEFSDSMGHYNPDNTAHPDHAGDLPPLLSCGGCAFMTVLTKRFSIHDILGRTVIIHSRRDDFITQPAGDSGTKIACGEIKKC